VFAAGKSPEQVAAVIRELLASGAAPVLATRATAAHAAALPEATFSPESGLLVARAAEPDPDAGRVAVVCAGTSDLPVAAEAAGTLQAFGVTADLVADVGVAGLHRVQAEAERLADADVC